MEDHKTKGWSTTLAHVKAKLTRKSMAKHELLNNDKQEFKRIRKQKQENALSISSSHSKKLQKIAVGKATPRSMENQPNKKEKNVPTASGNAQKLFLRKLIGDQNVMAITNIEIGERLFSNEMHIPVRAADKLGDKSRHIILNPGQSIQICVMR